MYKFHPGARGVQICGEAVKKDSQRERDMLSWLRVEMKMLFAWCRVVVRLRRIHKGPKGHKNHSLRLASLSGDLSLGLMVAFPLRSSV